MLLNQTNNQQTSICSSKAVIYLFFQFTTFTLNFIAALTLWRLKDHKTNISHLSVRVLVVSDVLGSAITIIPILVSCSGTSLVNGATCQVFGYLSSVFLFWTALIVLLLCTLRYLALVRPLFYRTHLTYRTVQYVLVCEFFWSAAHLLLPLVGIGRFKFYPEGQYCAFEIKPSNSSDAVLVHITVWEGWLTIIILLFFTVRMLKELRVKKKLAARLSFQQRRGVRAGGNRQQGYTLMTVVIVAIFLICYIPFLMFRMLALITKHVNEDHHYALHLLANLHPLVNPVIYVAFNKSYRRSVQILFESLCCCFAASVNRLRLSSSISMMLFSTSSDDVNQNSENRPRQATRSSFLTVPTFAPHSEYMPNKDEIKRKKFGHRRSFSDGISPTQARANPPVCFSDQLSTRKTIVKTYSNTSFIECHTNDTRTSQREKPRGLSLSSIAPVVAASQAKNTTFDQPKDDTFLPGTVNDSREA